MTNEREVELTLYDSDTGTFEPDGTVVSIYQLARSLNNEQFAALFDQFLNVGMKQYREGVQVGERLTKTHRTIQRQIIDFMFGVIVGISDQEHTDARNETAIATAKKITAMIEAGELSTGAFI